MTDLETVKTMLANAKIEHHIGSTDPEFDPNTARTVETITVYDGYGGFFSVFDFDEQGKLLRVSAWE